MITTLMLLITSVLLLVVNIEASPGHLGGFNPNQNQGSYGQIDFSKQKPRPWKNLPDEQLEKRFQPRQHQQHEGEAAPPPPPPAPPALPGPAPAQGSAEAGQEPAQLPKLDTTAKPPEGNQSLSLLEQLLAWKEKVWPEYKVAVIATAIVTVLVCLGALGTCVGCCCSGGGGGRSDRRTGRSYNSFNSSFSNGYGSGGGGGGRRHRGGHQRPPPSDRSAPPPRGRRGGGGGRKGGRGGPPSTEGSSSYP